MKFTMNLHENSLDYLTNALELYNVADEHGTHRKEKSNIDFKKKWKLAFVSLVQAMELLLKQELYSINPILIYVDIDATSEKTEKLGKTVTYSTALARLTNFEKNPYTASEEKTIKSCFGTRNQFMHFDVNIDTMEIKNMFATLYAIYKKGYEHLFSSPPLAENIKVTEICNQLEFFLNNLDIFRGEEFFKDKLNEYTEEINRNKTNGFFLSPDGSNIRRLKFGEEDNVLPDIIENGRKFQSLYTWEFCDDCGAKQGEYHLSLCDLEVCPICIGQVITCDCCLSLPN